MMYLIRDDTTGQGLYFIRGSVETAALNAPAGFSAVEVDPNALPDLNTTYFDPLDDYAEIARPDDLGIPPVLTVSDLLALGLPEEAVVTVSGFDGRPVGGGGTGLEDLDAEIGPSEGLDLEWTIVVERFPSVTHVGVLVSDPAP